MNQLADRHVDYRLGHAREGLLPSTKCSCIWGGGLRTTKPCPEQPQKENCCASGAVLYVVHHHGRFGTRTPTTDSVVQIIKTRCGETGVANGVIETSAVGLTSKLPTREVCLTTGAYRSQFLGRWCVDILRGKHWHLLQGKRPEGKVIRTLNCQHSSGGAMREA